jgi:uncharacterized membrane protein
MANNTGESSRRVAADAVRWVYSANQDSPPVIIAQPQGQTADAGSTATFTTLAAGTAPLSYQWRLNGADVAGATDSAYVRSNVQPGDAGTYSVVVANAVGSVTSSNAILTVNGGPVNVAPTISQQPQDLNVNQGSSAAFSVVATGTPAPAYQWRFNGTNISGATASSYVLAHVEPENAGSYSVVVTNVAGSVTSSNAMLAVTQPIPTRIDWISVMSGGQVQLQASGNPGHYSVEVTTDLADWVELTNFTTTNATFQFIDAAGNLIQRFYRTRLMP